VDDLASAAVENVTSDRNEIVNAIGPETFTYRELVETVRRLLGLKRPLLAFLLSLVTGRVELSGCLCVMLSSLARKYEG